MTLGAFAATDGPACTIECLCRKPIAFFKTGLESPFKHRIFTCLGVKLDEKTEFCHQKNLSPDSRPVKMILLEKLCVFNVQHDSFSQKSD